MNSDTVREDGGPSYEAVRGRVGEDLQRRRAKGGFAEGEGQLDI